MSLFQNSYFDNSFLYPNQAFLVLVLLYILLIATVVTFGLLGIKKRENILSALSKNPVFSLLIVAVMVYASRIIVMFFNASHVQTLPEQVFVMDMVGRDWLDGVIQPVMRLWKGVPFNPQVGYGQGFTIVIGIIFYPLYKVGVVSQETLIHFSQVSYVYLASLVSLSYLVLIVTKYKSEIRNVLLIVFVTFILGYSGSLGLERGNTDIIFSLIIVLLYFLRIRKQGSSNTLVLIEGCALGMLTASKISILPIALAFVLTSRQLLSSVIYFFISYSAFSLSPVIFGVKSSLLDSYNSSNIFQKTFFSNVLSISCWAGSHVLRGVASNFVLCSQIALEEFHKIFIVIINLVFYILVGVVFIAPLRPLLSHLKNTINSFLSSNRDKFLLLFIVLAVAAINLLPIFSFSYRLYYSFALLLAAWYSISNFKAKQMVLVSTLCLLLKGIWFVDWKILNVLIALHYMSLIYAASLELYTTVVSRKGLYGRKKE